MLSSSCMAQIICFPWLKQEERWKSCSNWQGSLSLQPVCWERLMGLGCTGRTKSQPHSVRYLSSDTPARELCRTTDCKEFGLSLAHLLPRGPATGQKGWVWQELHIIVVILHLVASVGTSSSISDISAIEANLNSGVGWDLR